MLMHDAHCHIDLYPSYRAELAAIAEGGVKTMAVTNAPSVFDAMVRLASGNPSVFPAIGMHPELVRDRSQELPLLLERLDGVRFVGEVGLDFAGSAGDRIEQVHVLERIVAACTSRPGKILSLHSRRAEKEVVQLVGANFPGTAILHWYSGSLKVLDQALASGFYFSVNTAMISSERGRAIIAALPPGRVLTESDGPFIKIDGAPARPADVRRVVAYLASHWRTTMPEAEAIVDRNFEGILTARNLRGGN
jgi:TatD DNase family protein